MNQPIMQQTFDFNRNHFELFGIEPRFGIEMAALDKAYRQLQSKVHPDRFVHMPDAERRVAMQWATHVNGAYRTLRYPQDRAKYLLELAGAAFDENAGTTLPAELLMEQIEWREKLEAAGKRHDAEELSALEKECAEALRECRAELERTLDRERDLAAARLALFRLMYLDKLESEIGDALETIATAN